MRKPLIDAQGAHFRFAVADGATESSYAGIWAKQLVRAFCKGLLDYYTIWDNLPNLQLRWSQIVRERVMAQGRPLPWYAEEKIEMVRSPLSLASRSMRMSLVVAVAGGGRLLSGTVVWLISGASRF